MENDPGKKESKGKRFFKKALRRNSKTSNTSQNSQGQSTSVPRSKSFENKNNISRDVNDSTPLPTPDKSKDSTELTTKADNRIQVPLILLPLDEECPSDDGKSTKVKSLQSKSDATSVSLKNAKSRVSPTFVKKAEAENSKKDLKRKLEEESTAGTSGASTGASDTDADDKDPSKDKKKKNRCAVCRKKVGLTGFECRCGGLFCAVHRYSDKHECSFDYRELGAQEIRRNNPVVVSQKIHKI